jgi:hypothetical protein
LPLSASFLGSGEESVEQAKGFQAVMMRATEDVSKPIMDAFEKALKEHKAP